MTGRTLALAVARQCAGRHFKDALAIQAAAANLHMYHLSCYKQGYCNSSLVPTLLLVAVGAVVSYVEPTVHLAHVAHCWFLPTEKVPLGHAWHTRSLVVVGAVFTNEPEVQSVGVSHAGRPAVS